MENYETQYKYFDNENIKDNSCQLSNFSSLLNSILKLRSNYKLIFNLMSNSFITHQLY